MDEKNKFWKLKYIFHVLDIFYFYLKLELLNSGKYFSKLYAVLFQFDLYLLVACSYVMSVRCWIITWKFLSMHNITVSKEFAQRASHFLKTSDPFIASAQWKPFSYTFYLIFTIGEWWLLSLASGGNKVNRKFSVLLTDWQILILSYISVYTITFNTWI